MRFTSLIVELIRSRPGLVVCVVLLVQAAIWIIVPTLFFSSPPGDVATVLAYGREYRVGSVLGPPLAFWFADLAFRVAGDHIVGVYLLGQLCLAATLALLFQIGRATVGGPHAVLGVLLTMTIFAFGWPDVEFGPRVLAQPLWAWALLSVWQIVGQRRRGGWFTLSLAAGLLLLTTRDAWWMLLALAVFMLASDRARRQLASFDPLYAFLVIVALALPWWVWLLKAGNLVTIPATPDPAGLKAAAINAAWLLVFLLLSTPAALFLLAMNSRWFARERASQGTAPTIVRAGIDPLARNFIYVFALGMPLLSALFGAIAEPPAVAGAPGIALLMTGLAAVVASGDVIALRRQKTLRRAWAFAVALPAIVACLVVIVVPWLGRMATPSTFPATAMARFFAESFERRTGHPLPAVAGDADIAALVALAPSRPHFLLATAPDCTPWITPAKFTESGGLVVWRASDTAGAPPPDLAKRFPDLVPEVPRTFEHWLGGRQTPPRIGWAIVRPKVP